MMRCVFGWLQPVLFSVLSSAHHHHSLKHTCALGHLSPSKLLLLNRYTLSLCPFWKMCTIQLCSKKRQGGPTRLSSRVSERQRENVRYLNPNWWVSPLCWRPHSMSDKRTHSVFYYLFPRVGQYIIHRAGPRQLGTLRHFSREGEEEEKASWRASHLTIAHTSPTYICSCFKKQTNTCWNDEANVPSLSRRGRGNAWFERPVEGLLVKRWSFSRSFVSSAGTDWQIHFFV